MSVIRRVSKVAAGAAVGVGVALAVNPEARRRVAAQSLRFFQDILRRVGGAVEAGRRAAHQREMELEKLLSVEDDLPNGG